VSERANELLERWWENSEILKSGSPITKITPTNQMPPWHEICAKLNWSQGNDRSKNKSGGHHEASDKAKDE
jgi:hypothetical protein